MWIRAFKSIFGTIFISETVSRVRLSKVESPEESLHRAMENLALQLPPGMGLKRNDRSEHDFDSYNEGVHVLRTDKRELGHR